MRRLSSSIPLTTIEIAANTRNGLNRVEHGCRARMDERSRAERVRTRKEDFGRALKWPQRRPVRRPVRGSLLIELQSILCLFITGILRILLVSSRLLLLQSFSGSSASSSMESTFFPSHFARKLECLLRVGAAFLSIWTVDFE